MGFITEVVTPLVKVVFLSGFFVAWIVAGVWLFFKYVLTKKRRLWIKYHVLRKKYDEKFVKWCLDAYDKGYRDEIEIKKILLMKGKFSLKKVEEMIFIFSELKELKGGNDKTHGRIRQGSGEIELPKVKEKEKKGRRG